MPEYISDVPFAPATCHNGFTGPVNEEQKLAPNVFDRAGWQQFIGYETGSIFDGFDN
jgi:hypothetical protein